MVRRQQLRVDHITHGFGLGACGRGAQIEVSVLLWRNAKALEVVETAGSSLRSRGGYSMSWPREVFTGAPVPGT